MEKPKKLTILQKRKKDKVELAINRMCNNLLDLKKHNATGRCCMGYSYDSTKVTKTVRGAELKVFTFRNTINIEDLPLLLRGTDHERI